MESSRLKPLQSKHSTKKNIVKLFGIWELSIKYRWIVTLKKMLAKKICLQLVCFIWSDFYANISQGDANGQYWLGAIRDTDDPKNWKWIDGKTVTVSFWNLPGGNENCARFDGTKGWLWSDTNCGLKLNFICQHRMFTFFLSLFITVLFFNQSLFH